MGTHRNLDTKVTISAAFLNFLAVLLVGGESGGEIGNAILAIAARTVRSLENINTPVRFPCCTAAGAKRREINNRGVNEPLLMTSQQNQQVVLLI